MTAYVRQRCLCEEPGALRESGYVLTRSQRVTHLLSGGPRLAHVSAIPRDSSTHYTFPVGASGLPTRRGGHGVAPRPVTAGAPPQETIVPEGRAQARRDGCGAGEREAYAESGGCTNCTWGLKSGKCRSSSALIELTWLAGSGRRRGDQERRIEPLAGGAGPVRSQRFSNRNPWPRTVTM